MIVTSKRCFLNVLTQLCDADTLLNANYYMADVRTPDGSVQFNDSLKYDEYGHLQNVNSCQSLPPPSIGKYNINYGHGELDPTIYITNVLVGLGDVYDNPVERFIKHINSSETFLSVYDFLFSRQLKGNGLQILIFSDDAATDIFIDLVCQYLSHNFGCDITFLDPQYRPNITGQVEYIGNKVNAQKVIHDICDTKLLMNFELCLSQSGGDECINNLQVHLNQYNVSELIYLYNLLFPEAPLPPDNYTQDHVKQIIIGRVSSQIPKNPFSNILLANDYAEFVKDYDFDEADFDDLF